MNKKALKIKTSKADIYYMIDEIVIVVVKGKTSPTGRK